jgi:hypothetical protein
MNANNGLNAVLGELFRKFESAKQIICIRDRHRRHLIGFAKVDQLANRQCAYAQRKGRMHMQMDETNVLDLETHLQRSNDALYFYGKAELRRGLCYTFNKSLALKRLPCSMWPNRQSLTGRHLERRFRPDRKSDFSQSGFVT